jgi:hypothetical protein
MSILQLSSGNASAIMQSLINTKPPQIEWPNYINACSQIAERQVESFEQVLARKRAHALKYLGDKARTYGERYNKAEPRVFTPCFVAELERANSVRRLKRNPWLESMLNGVGEDGSPLSSFGRGNILPFGPQIVTQNDAALN